MTNIKSQSKNAKITYVFFAPHKKGYLGTLQKRVGQLPKAGTDPGCDILDDQHDDDDKVEEEKQKRVGEREKGHFLIKGC